jgi:TolB protein
MIPTKHRAIGLLATAAVVLLSIGLAGTVMASDAGSAAVSVWGPDAASAPATDWQPLPAGESHWYAFNYAGDGSQITIQLQVEPVGSSDFVVWTPDQIYHWGLGEYVEPVGRSSAAPSAGGHQAWSGNFRSAGTYYIVAEHTGNQPGVSYYLLTVSGDGVSLPSEDVLEPKAEPKSAPTARPKVTRSKANPPANVDGTLVFQTAPGGLFCTINVDGTDLQPIATGLDPVWSPDGSQIAFARWEDPRGIWVVNADGTNEHRVFDWPRETRYPSWSPDGEQIVFVRQHRGRIEPTRVCFEGPKGQVCRVQPPDPHYNLGVVRVGDGSFWEPLPSSSERSLAPDWSPVVDEVVYADVYGLFVQSADGQTRYQLTANNRDTTPAWSPDGEHVAFVRRQHDHWEIYVVDADGQNLRRLTDTPIKSDGAAGSSVSPAWSPDGSYLAFLTDQSGQWEIWIVKASGRNPQPFFGPELGGLPLDYGYNDERALSWTR